MPGKHIVKNHRKLTRSSKLRAAALSIIEGGIAAVNTEVALREKIKFAGNKLKVERKTYDLSRFEKIYVIGFGKASLGASIVLEKILGKRITAGAVIDVKGGRLKRIKSHVGTHPFPSNRNLAATADIVALLKQASPRDLVLTIVSGGGSALLFWPFAAKLKNIVCVTKTLMENGVNINDMNKVRKHLSAIQGGQLVGLAGRATMISLIFSDVPGDDVSVISSGPTVLDKTTKAEAFAVIKDNEATEKCGIRLEDLTETPKDPAVFRKVQNVLVVNNSIAIQAMVNAARRLGFKPRIFSTAVTGEAREVGKFLVNSVKPGEVLIAAGETTVTKTGTGKGGRNQEVVLGALTDITRDTVVISVASDGRDNGSFAGALGDSETLLTAAKKKLSVNDYLKNNNSSEFFRKSGDYIETGVTGINIADLVLVVRGENSQRRQGK